MTQLRSTCIAIDRSTQRFERFIATQHDLPVKQRLTVIRDVPTRWNSTYDMCERAIRLQPYLDQWLEGEIALKTTTRARNLSVAASNDTAEVDSQDLKMLRLTTVE
jgi:hypothetical protein